jgi:hypothetical protein
MSNLLSILSLNDIDPNDLLIALLDDIKPERFIDLCVNYNQKQINAIYNTKYKAKFIEGQQSVKNLSIYIKDLMKEFGLYKPYYSNNTFLNKITKILTHNPNTFALSEINHHFKTQAAGIETEYCNSLKDLIKQYIQMNDDSKTDEELINIFIEKKHKDVIYYNNSYTHNVEIYGSENDTSIYKYNFIKINNRYHVVFFIKNGGKYYVRSMPNHKHRISNFVKLRKKLLIHMINIPYALDYTDKIKRIIRLIDKSVYGSFELKWFDYAICEAIYGRFFKLYEVYVKN